MRPSIGQYVRVLHDFDTSQKGEISVLKGDIIQVLEVIDDNWLSGRLSNVEGRFPNAFVESIHWPNLQPGQKVFAAIEEFQAAQSGDLGITKGDIILGLKAVDENWWEGNKEDQTGIFPLTCVLELQDPGKRCEKQVHKNTRSVDEPLYARALVDITPQLDGELGFGLGDIITVLEIVDNDWYMGEFGGKEGLVSSVCVELFGGSSESDAGNQTSDNQTVNNQVSNQQTSDNVNNSKNPVENHEQEELAKTEQPGEDSSSAPVFSSENTRSHDAEITPYARTTYAFQGQSKDELTFMPNEIITLIQHVDSDWIEGELDGKMGLFPASYVEIIVDCPYATEPTQIEPGDPPVEGSCASVDDSSVDHGTVNSANGAENLSVNSDSEHFGLVLYNFQGEMDGDLHVYEGETVIIVQILDESWLQARNESGHVGLVPLNHVQVIGEGPSHLPSDTDVQSPTSMPKENGYCVDTNQSPEKADAENNNKIESEEINTKSPDPEPVKQPPKPKPQLKPKPKLAPKPVIKPKPVLLAPKTFKPSGMSTSMNKGHVSAHQEKSVFKGINTSKSLNSLIEDQLHIAKSEADEENRSRSSSNRSSGSSSSGGMRRQESLPANISSLPSDLVKRSRPSSWVSDKSGSDIFEDIANLDSLANSGNSNSLSKFDFKNACQASSVQTGSHQSIDSTSQSSMDKDVHVNNDASVKSDGFVNNAFVRDSDEPHPPHHPMRPPPPVPSSKSFRTKSGPSRAPPPRPSAPRATNQPAANLTSNQTSSKPHPVPQRPAPPAPKGPPKMTSRPPPRPNMPSAPRRPPPRPPARSGNDLMSFSPERDIPDGDQEDTVNQEVVGELKSRIAEIQKDIQNYEKSCEELKLMLCQVDDGERAEILETLDDQRANVQGLTHELATLRQNLHELCPAEQRRYEEERELERRKEDVKRRAEEEKQRQEEMKMKRREKREKVIQELMATEKDYLHDLHLCIDTFLGPSAEKVSGVDMEALFGNIEEIADVSQRFLTRLEGCICGKDFHEQLIGHNFVDFAEDMKNTYAPYCRNHDTVITVMEKYADNAEFKDYVCRMITRLREQINVFDLESLLIKPVQRILKYPLLLNELFKSTEDEHEDKAGIVKAIGSMTDVATAINEYKRRKDLVYKYKKDTSDQRFSDKIAKLNFHSIRKKGSRMRGRLSTNLGLGLQTRDENFEREETRFRHIEKAVRIFQKNVIVYMDQVQESVGAQESLVADILDLYDTQSSQELKKFCEVQEKIVGTLVVAFRGTVDMLVISPLSQLVQMFEGPNKVIEKRFDKLLDYDSQFRKAKDNEKNDALQSAKNNYEAMNAQLLDELPKLCDQALKLLTDCMGAFTKAQRRFTDTTLKETYSLGQLPLLLQTDTGLMESFNVAHTTALDKVSALTLIPRGFNPKMDTLKGDKNKKRLSVDQGGKSQAPAGSSSPQSDSQRVYLRQLYPAGKLFRVGYTYTAMDLMDLSLKEGLMVGIIKEQDPMGNKDKWFIDDGVNKGFVPKKILTPLVGEGGGAVDVSPSGSLTSLTLEEGPDLLGGTDLGSDTQSMTSTTQAVYPSITTDITDSTPQPEEYYYAEYAFQSRSASEVTMFEGQVVTVLAKHDLEGNTEWWMVDADGQRGYAPANYLRPMS